jgi:hypothetical protein
VKQHLTLLAGLKLPLLGMLFLPLVPALLAPLLLALAPGQHQQQQRLRLPLAAA